MTTPAAASRDSLSIGGARRAAAVLVAEVLDRGRTLDDALAATRSFAALEGRDRAFARAIASATLRRLGGIDLVLSGLMQRPLPDSAALARAILRTGAAQLLVLKSPAHAAVSESVAVARAAKSGAPFASLINAVLRRVATEGQAALDAAPAGVDLPGWLYSRWRTAYGAESAAAIAHALLMEAPLDLTVTGSAEAWAEKLGGVALNERTVRLVQGGDVPTLPGYDEGAWWVQDAAAAMPVAMLGDVAGLKALDMCAAPGGKTLQLASAGADVTALDLSSERVGRLEQNLGRTRLRARTATFDALQWREGGYDLVVLDAPCSATGTLRRHPDVAWLRRPGDLAALTALQMSLIDRAIDLTKPGGRILYAVCSLEPEEGEGAISSALSRHQGRISTEGPPLRTTPADLKDAGGMDGFFAQVLRRA